MINYVLLLISVFLGVSKNIISKAGGDLFSGLNNLFKVNIVTSIISMIIFGMTGVNTGLLLTPLIIFFVIAYGVFTMLSQMLFIEAVKKNSVAVCSLIYSCGFIIPTVFSLLFYKEIISVFQVIGLILLTVSFLFVTEAFGSSSKQKNNLTLAFLAMLSSGIVGVLQKLISIRNILTEFNSFLFFVFCIILIISVLGTCFTNKKAQKKCYNLKFFILAIILGTSFAFANKINIKLSGIIPGVIFFPIVNGGCIALSAIISSLLFSERLSKTKKRGILLGIISIIIIAVF